MTHSTSKIPAIAEHRVSVGLHGEFGEEVAAHSIRFVRGGLRDQRTASEVRSLYEQAGFELEYIIPTPSPLHIIIGK